VRVDGRFGDVIGVLGNDHQRSLVAEALDPYVARYVVLQLIWLAIVFVTILSVLGIW
jgi:hypothetical protein